jgi:hypothetical protein
MKRQYPGVDVVEQGLKIWRPRLVQSENLNAESGASIPAFLGAGTAILKSG